MLSVVCVQPARDAPMHAMEIATGLVRFASNKYAVVDEILSGYLNACHGDAAAGVAVERQRDCAVPRDAAEEAAWFAPQRVEHPLPGRMELCFWWSRGGAAAKLPVNARLRRWAYGVAPLSQARGTAYAAFVYTPPTENGAAHSVVVPTTTGMLCSAVGEPCLAPAADTNVAWRHAHAVAWRAYAAAATATLVKTSTAAEQDAPAENKETILRSFNAMVRRYPDGEHGTAPQASTTTTTTAAVAPRTTTTTTTTTTTSAAPPAEPLAEPPAAPAAEPPASTTTTTTTAATTKKRGQAGAAEVADAPCSSHRRFAAEVAALVEAPGKRARRAPVTYE